MEMFQQQFMVVFHCFSIVSCLFFDGLVLLKYFCQQLCKSVCLIAGFCSEGNCYCYCCLLSFIVVIVIVIVVIVIVVVVVVIIVIVIVIVIVNHSVTVVIVVVMTQIGRTTEQTHG